MDDELPTRLIAVQGKFDYREQSCTGSNKRLSNTLNRESGQNKAIVAAPFRVLYKLVTFGSEFKLVRVGKLASPRRDVIFRQDIFQRLGRRIQKS